MRTAILLTAVLLLASLFMLSCTITTTEYTDLWKITGTADITDASTIVNNVKLACYYTRSETDFGSAANPTLVSNVEDLGNDPSIDSAFTLNINVTSLDPTTGFRIYLIMWEDTNSDGKYDAIEDWANVEPQLGCPVFQTANFCYYIFDSWTGWNQAIGFDTYASVDLAVKTGALIVNSTDL